MSMKKSSLQVPQGEKSDVEEIRKCVNRAVVLQDPPEEQGGSLQKDDLCRHILKHRSFKSGFL